MIASGAAGLRALRAKTEPGLQVHFRTFIFSHHAAPLTGKADQSAKRIHKSPGVDTPGLFSFLDCRAALLLPKTHLYAALRPYMPNPAGWCWGEAC